MSDTYTLYIFIILFFSSLSPSLGQSSIAVHYYNDVDNDEIENGMDNCPDSYNPSQEDYDGDGIGDICDPICEKYLSEEIFIEEKAVLITQNTLKDIQGWKTTVDIKQTENIIIDLNLIHPSGSKLNRKSTVFLKTKGIYLAKSNPRWIREIPTGHSYKLSYSIPGLPKGSHDFELILANKQGTEGLIIQNFNVRSTCEYPSKK